MLSLKTRSKSVAKKGLMAGMTEPIAGAAVATGWNGASILAAASFRATATRRRMAGADAIADISVCELLRARVLEDSVLGEPDSPKAVSS